MAGTNWANQGYIWITDEFVNPYQKKVDKWKVDAANGSSSAKTNLKYYSEGGAGYNEAKQDWLIEQTAPIAAKLGVTTDYLLTNPIVATNAAELARSKSGMSLAKAQKAIASLGFIETKEALTPLAGLTAQGLGVKPTEQVDWTKPAPAVQPASGYATETPSGVSIAAVEQPQTIPFKSGLSDTQKKSITDLINSGKSFNETDAKNYAYAIGEKNWQQYENKTGTQITSGTTTPTTPVTPTTTQKATLYGPNNKPEVVDVGSARASELQSQGWGLTKDSYKAPGTAPPEKKEEAIEPTVPETIYGDTEGVAPAAGGVKSAIDQLEETFKLYPNLSEEQKNYIRNLVTLNTSVDEAQKAAAQKALDEAKTLADPFYKSQFLMADDEMQRAVGSTTADVLSSIGSLQTKINQINEDLSYNRDQISLEQQAQMTDLLGQYKSQLTDLSQRAAESGLAFSSPRKLAEQRLKEQQTSSAESISRKTAQALRQAETGSLRDIQYTSQQIADVTRQGAERTLDLMRQGEAKLGTAGTPESYNKLGTTTNPITGTLEDERQKAILQLQTTLLNKYDPLTGNLK